MDFLLLSSHLTNILQGEGDDECQGIILPDL